MTDRNDDPIKALWRGQSTEVPAMSASYVRHRTGELHRAFRIRNVLEQGTSLLALAGCLIVIVLAPHPWIKSAVALLLIGGAYALFQWRRRTASLGTDPSESVTASLTFYKHELERKRDIHRTLWRWYLLPLAPGVIGVLSWNFFGDPQTRGTSAPWVVLGLLVVWIVFSVIYERYKAAQCQREIDALSALETDPDSGPAR
jgi:CDP-diglyceride synthetase